MKNLHRQFKRFNPSLGEDDFNLIEPFLMTKEYPVGFQLIRNNHVCYYLHFLQVGAVRCYSFIDDRTIWIEFENSFFTLIQSFMLQIPTSEGLTFIEPSVIYSIHYNDLQKLYKTNIEWANWGRGLGEYWLTYIENIYKSMLYLSASERYYELIRYDNRILQRVPLKYIASFLGISQVSLSRIRGNKQTL